MGIVDPPVEPINLEHGDAFQVGALDLPGNSAALEVPLAAGWCIQHQHAGFLRGQAIEIGRAIHTGSVIINDSSNYRADHMPYGGVKRSGMGREGIRYAMSEMMETKLLVFNLT